LHGVPSEIGAGIAGVGFMDAARARAVQRAGGRFVGVTTSTPERAKEASVDLNADRAFLWPEALTADEQVDVVISAFPISFLSRRR
jgi:predicted dehydrogenase